MSVSKEDASYAIIPVMALIEEFSTLNKQPHNKFSLPVNFTKTKSGWGAELSSTKTLLDALNGLRIKPVEVFLFDTSLAPDIDGYFEEQEDKVTIFINSSLNFCWRRFIIAKEITHLLMNHLDPKLRVSTYQEISNQITHRSIDFTPLNTAVASENWAYYGAVEMLLPTVLMIDNKEECRATADIARCPLSIVEFRLKQENQAFYKELYQSQNRKDALLKIKASPLQT